MPEEAPISQQAQGNYIAQATGGGTATVTVVVPPLSLTEKQRKQNRTRMLDRVQAIWIDGVLEPSVQGVAQIALELQHKPSAVMTPLWQVLREFDTTGRLSSAESSIVQVYDHANGEVLILGEPGAGKTTLLLELTRDLLERACQDETHPIPVVFSLSSWASRRQPLTEWLASELHIRYQVPLPLATSWIETDQVLPLLDGLDEVAAPHRAACVEAINTYRQAHGLLPIVVCSRQTDYLVLSMRLLLRTAVVVQPLTPEQIETYLESAGEQAEVLQAALHQDADLRELATTPLMLMILLFAYRGTSPDKISELTSLGAKREQLFAFYVQHMLKRRGASKRYQPEQITHWLTSLARQMRRQNQTLFYLEQMQPDWLSSNRMLGVYHWVAVRLPGVLIGILVSFAFTVVITYYDLLSLIPIILLGGLLGGLLSEGSIPQRLPVSGGKARSALGPRLLQWLLIGALIGLGSGLLFELSLGLSWGLSFGLSFGLGSILLQFLLGKNHETEARSPTPPPAKGTIWQRLLRRREVRNGLLVGLLIGLLVGWSWGLNDELSFGLTWGLSEVLRDGLDVGLSWGLSAGLSAWLLSILLIGRSIAVQPMDLIVWSWRSLGKSLLSKSHASMIVRFIVPVGLIIGVLFGLNAGPRTGLIVGPVWGMLVGLGCWLLLGFFRGVSSATIEDQRRVVPNQGIHRSALNGLALGLISTVIVGLLCSLFFRLLTGLSAGLGAGLVYGLPNGLPTGPLTGLSAGLSAGLLYGGLACLRHYVLRFLLWCTGSVPWHYVPFLDYAAERILLRKVGGGYIFLHRLLLDYFAARETAPVLDETTGRRQAGIPAPVSLSNVPSEPRVLSALPDLSAPTISLAPPPTLSEAQHLLPCGHELRPSARFCSVCGASIMMYDTPASAPAVSPSSTGESASFGGFQPPSLTHSSSEELLRTVGPSVPPALVSQSDTAIISPRRGLPASRTVLLVGLVLLVIMGGAGFLTVLFPWNNQRPGPTGDACPDVLSQTQSCQTPHSLRVAYGVESLVEHGFTGKGQTIIDIDSFGSPTLQQDMDVFDNAFGLPPIKIQVISPLGTVPFDATNQTMVGWASQTAQDVQIMHALAPDAGIIVLTSPVAESEGTIGLPEFRQLIQYAIDHHLGNIISNSWGASEATLKDQAGRRELQKWDSMLQNATTQQGITFFTATGTNGATDYTDIQGTKLSQTPTIGFPEDEPWVTSVGGTTLLNKGQRAQENAWSSSGGGFSAIYPTPLYQQTLTASRRQNGRGVPDVAADADPSTGIAIYYHGSWQQAGGTAASGPMWAALGAIANQMSGHPLGFINPGLYKVAMSSMYTQAFHDITVGNNDVNSNGVKVKGYAAAPGWDPVTGWGSPNAEVLLPALVAALKQ